MVAKKRDPVEQLRSTKAGYSQADLVAILESYGFEFVRDAKHGLVYENAELANAGASKEASIMIPRGRELRKVYAADVLKSVEAVLAHREEEVNDDPS